MTLCSNPKIKNRYICCETSEDASRVTPGGVPEKKICGRIPGERFKEMHRKGCIILKGYYLQISEDNL